MFLRVRRYDPTVSAYRLRRAGREFLVIDRESLIQMAANGQVRHGDDAWFEERWQPVAALPELRGKLGTDPWDAWDENEGAKADSIVAKFQTPEAEPEELVPEELEPERGPARGRVVVRRVAEPTVIHPEPDLPDEEDSGDDGEADEVEPEAQGRGQVIAFPRPRRPVELPPMPANTPRGATPAVRASRVFGWLVLGMVALGIGWLWMWSVSSSAGVQKAYVRPAATTKPTPLIGAGASGAGTGGSGVASSDSLHEMLASLRARLPQEVKSVRQPPDLADAILIELQNLQTSVETVDAAVTHWSGPRGDQPKEATVVVTFRDTQTLNRDLLSFGLVLGRYMQAYPMKIPDARVIFHAETGDTGMAIEAQTCADLYRGRITLQQFLGT